MKQKEKEVFITAEEIATLRNLGCEGILNKARSYNPVAEESRKKKKDKICR